MIVNYNKSIRDLKIKRKQLIFDKEKFIKDIDKKINKQTILIEKIYRKRVWDEINFVKEWDNFEWNYKGECEHCNTTGDIKTVCNEEWLVSINDNTLVTNCINASLCYSCFRGWDRDNIVKKEGK